MTNRSQKGLRTFLAIPLPESLKKQIGTIQSDLQERSSGVRWVKPDNLHLTLRFFGETSHEDLEKIKGSMLSVERIQKPFEVEVQGLGAFPSPRRPRVLWLGLTPGAPLVDFFRVCQQALEQAGIPPEQRPLAPHLTIGRLRQHGSDLSALTESYAQRSFGTLPVTQAVLYESRLHQHGAEHLPLQTMKLSGADTPES